MKKVTVLIIAVLTAITAMYAQEMHIHRNDGTTITVPINAIDSLTFADGNEGDTPPVAAFTATPTTGTVPLTVNFADQSTNNPTSWQWSFGDGNSSTQQYPQHTYQNAGNYTVQLIAANNHGIDMETKTNFISVYSLGFGFNVFNPATGKIWMDRNLGASRVAQSSNDDQAYGDLYQWGRLTDGHENRTSVTTSTLCSSDVPGLGNFITVISSPWDWRSPQNDSLWQGVNGTNNPCPAGYRLPTEAEWNAERLSWSSNNAAGAFNSPLKLPVAGYRDSSNGSLLDVGSDGYYWSASVDGTRARYLHFYSSDALMISLSRANGDSVRCIKD